MTIKAGSLSKNQAIEAMNNKMPREIEVEYGDFTLTCRVGLSLTSQFALIEQVKRSVVESETSDVNTARSPLFRRALFEIAYMWCYTDISEVLELGDGDNLGNEQLIKLANELNLIGILSQADEQTRRMFDNIWESIEYRIHFEDGLLTANLSNQKLNQFLEEITTAAHSAFSMLDSFKELLQAENDYMKMSHELVTARNNLKNATDGAEVFMAQTAPVMEEHRRTLAEQEQPEE